jgi:hypothetical protein
MESFQELNRAGEPWEISEGHQLIKEYNVDKLNLLEICNIHKRMPGGIIARLKRFNLIDKPDNIRGYAEYQQSDLYGDISKYKKEKRLEKKLENKKQKIIAAPANVPLSTNNTSDIAELKKDVKEIKESINKILELMNAVYQFETTNEETN